MESCHPNPGYGNSVSKMERAQNAKLNNYIPGYNSLRAMENISLDRPTLEDIRRQAREAWTPKVQNSTSYQDHYSEKFSKMGEFTASRPTSANRKNKPHPPMVFLTNRLHYCPGYHNADTTLGKEPYQIDASMAPHERYQRAQLRGKFIGKPSSAALRQYQADNEEFEFCENPLDRQVTQAMLTSNSSENVLADLNELKYTDNVHVRGNMERTYRPRTVASLHRYLKHAGAEETAKMDNIYNRYLSAYEFGARVDDLDSRRHNDMVNMTRVKVNNGRASRRGDFLMHPEWPPTFKAHRLNGLSSIDLPYSYSKR